jgi:hypothetical protein
MSARSTWGRLLRRHRKRRRKRYERMTEEATLDFGKRQYADDLTPLRER